MWLVLVSICLSESVVALSMLGCHILLHPLIQRYFSILKWVYCTQTLIITEHHISSLHSHFWVQLSAGSPFLQTDKNGEFLYAYFKSKDPAIIEVRRPNSLGTLIKGRGQIVDYKPKYFSRRDKRAKSTYFMKNSDQLIKVLYKYLFMERGEISSE